MSHFYMLPLVPFYYSISNDPAKILPAHLLRRWHFWRLYCPCWSRELCDIKWPSFYQQRDRLSQKPFRSQLPVPLVRSGSCCLWLRGRVMLWVSGKGDGDGCDWLWLILGAGHTLLPARWGSIWKVEMHIIPAFLGYTCQVRLDNFFFNKLLDWAGSCFIWDFHNLCL